VGDLCFVVPPKEKEKRDREFSLPILGIHSYPCQPGFLEKNGSCAGKDQRPGRGGFMASGEPGNHLRSIVNARGTFGRKREKTIIPKSSAGAIKVCFRERRKVPAGWGKSVSPGPG